MLVYACAALRIATDMVGAYSVSLDCAENLPNVDIAQANAAEVDILITPFMFGSPAVLPEGRGYRVFEELAQSLGAKVVGALIGLRGDIEVRSFLRPA